MRFAVLLLMLVVAAACLEAAPADVRGRTFLSVSVTDGGAERPLVPGTHVRLTFGGEGRLTAQAGCNTFGGDYRLEGGVLRIDGGGMTEIGCEPGLAEQDAWVFEFLGSRPAVTLGTSDLMLASGSVVMRLVDREVADPDLPLVGPTWTVTTIIEGEVASSVPTENPPTLAFGADGTVHIDTGCNTGTGRAIEEGRALRIADVVLTKRACDDPAAATEQAVLRVLSAGQVGYRIEASMLSLDAGGSGLQLIGS